MTPKEIGVKSGDKGFIGARPAGYGEPFGVFQKEKTVPDPKNTETFSAAKRAERYHESKLFSIPSITCHSQKQSFINGPCAKFILTSPVLCPLKRLST
jgi:hypothetical protein